MTDTDMTDYRIRKLPIADLRDCFGGAMPDDLTITRSLSSYGMEQIAVSGPEGDRRALLTRFAGERTWAVALSRRGSFGDWIKTLHERGFLRGVALYEAIRWVDAA